MIFVELASWSLIQMYIFIYLFMYLFVCSYILFICFLLQNLYNFLLNSIEERGITDEFVEKLSDLASALEHKLYIDFLQKLQGIAKF